jgi:hypothetical protein
LYGRKKRWLEISPDPLALQSGISADKRETRTSRSACSTAYVHGCEDTRDPEREPEAEVKEGSPPSCQRGEPPTMAAPDIEGTYRLVQRELPDGTVKLPPAVKGMFTYTKEFRHFSVLWQDDQGRFYSECYVARYTLTDKEYAETSEYLIVDDQIGGKGISYDLAVTCARSPVVLDRGRITFALPQPFEKALGVTLEFDGATLKASGKDLFTDYWEKVS